MSVTSTLLDALPGTLPELVERTGYDMERVLKFIVLARAEGHRITVKQVDGVSVFERLTEQPSVAENGTDE